MGKNIYLSQVNYKTGSGVYSGYWVPYSIACLWAYVQQFDWVKESFNLKEILFKREPVEKVVERITSPSIFAFSCYIWNWEYNKKLAKAVKSKFPNCIIVFGGPQISNRPEETNFFGDHPYVDCISFGEGEKNFLRILEDFSKGNPLKQIYSFDRLSEEDLMYPSPYTLGLFDNIIENNPDIQWHAVLETNRGCPFKCSFCDWGSLTYSKIKKFWISRIIEDLEWSGKNKITYLSIADANFGCFKDRDMEITEELLKVQAKYGFPETVDATWYKNLNKDVINIVKKFIENGLNRGLSLSLQSMNFDTLEAIERSNMKLNKFTEILDICNAQQLPSYTELLIGLPLETLDTWITGVCDVLEAGQHNDIETWLVQMLENSQLNTEREKYQLDTVFVNSYFTTEPDNIEEKAELIRGTKDMPFEDLLDSWMFFFVVSNFHIYGWTQIYSIFLRKTQKISYKDFYTSLWEDIKSDNGFIGSTYKDVRKKLKHYLTTGDLEHENAYALNWTSQINFNKNRNDTLAFVRKYMEKYTISDDLQTAQEKFTTIYNLKETSVKLNSNIYEVCYKNENLKKQSKTYLLQSKENYSSEDQYNKQFYYKRKSGVGKYRIVNL
jgi:putative methyltransferase